MKNAAEKGHLNLAFESEKDQREKGTKEKVVGFMQKYVLAKSQKPSDNKVTSTGGDSEANEDQQQEPEEKGKKGTFIDRLIDSRCPENSGPCLKIFKVEFKISYVFLLSFKSAFPKMPDHDLHC